MADAKGKAPDNNKRLAALEAGVSALTIALTANGIALADGGDPIETAIGAVKQRAALEEQLHNLAGYASGTLGRIVPDLDLAPLTDEAPFAYLERLTAAANPRIDELLALDAAKGELTKLQGTVAELEAKLEAAGTPGTDAAELDELRKRVTELTGEVGELEQDLADMTDAKNALANQLADDGKGTATPPAAPDPVIAPPEPEPIERPAAARDVGPAFGQFTDTAIGALVAEGGRFEVAFSNGEFEIVDFAPVKLAAKDLNRVNGSRYIVAPALSIKGALAPVSVHGAGLIYEGEQVSYCRFDPSVVVQPGQERRFDRALIFG